MSLQQSATSRPFGSGIPGRGQSPNRAMTCCRMRVKVFGHLGLRTMRTMVWNTMLKASCWFCDLLALFCPLIEAHAIAGDLGGATEHFHVRAPGRMRQVSDASDKWRVVLLGSCKSA